MPTRKTNALNTDEPSKLQAPAAVRPHGPTLLTEAELDSVAAAGGKPTGGGGGDIRCRH
jgi:hypothetical protein